ncbi:TolC family protein [Roseivirga sp. BDSF3-8]|uniref:TolC family protein n=1 Tax=Roseivirga sp. BDSF3-8 TaxID=3241598 RepID=UPI0035325A5D
MKASIRSFLFFLCLISTANFTRAQELPRLSPDTVLMHSAPLVTLDEALAIALRQNYSLRIAERDLEIAENNVTIGNAGFLPSLQASGNYNYSNQDTRIEFASPEADNIDRSGAVSESYGGALTLNYTIFGGGRFYIYDRLIAQSDIARLQESQAMQQTILDVSTQYLDMAGQYRSVQINEQAIAISAERYLRVKGRYEFGGVSKLELLNAEVDLRNDSITWKQSILAFKQQQNDFNVLLGVPVDTTYRIDTAFSYTRNLELQTILSEADQRNPSLRLAKLDRQVNELRVKETNAGFWPILDLSGGYQYNRTENEAGFVALQRTKGWNTALNLTFVIYDGDNRNRLVQNAEVNLASSDIRLEQARATLQADIRNAWVAYTTNVDLLESSLDNLEVARLQYTRSQEAFATGEINGLDLRDAQLNLIRARKNVSDQQIAVRQAEISLYYHAGLLVE